MCNQAQCLGLQQLLFLNYQFFHSMLLHCTCTSIECYCVSTKIRLDLTPFFSPTDLFRRIFGRIYFSHGNTLHFFICNNLFSFYLAKLCTYLKQSCHRLETTIFFKVPQKKVCFCEWKQYHLNIKRKFQIMKMKYFFIIASKLYFS